VKIALVTETYPPEINGVAMTLSELVNGLRERGHHVQVVRPMQSGERSSLCSDAEQVTVPGLPIPRYSELRFGLPAGRKLNQAWSTSRPDIVHVATEGPLGISAIRKAKALGIPTTSTFHTNFHSYSEHYSARFATGLILGFLRWVHNSTLCTMAPTEELRHALARDGFRNVEVFGRGVNLDVFNPQARDPNLREEWGACQDSLVFLHVSRLASEKNYKLLEQCYERIRSRHSNARFVIAGSGPLEKHLRRRMPYAVFTGSIPLNNRAELARIYASADVFIYPSKTETYGNVATEAMACGNALVAFDYAAAALHSQHGESSLLAPLDDDKALLELVDKVSEDPALARLLGARASSKAQAFDWRPVVEKFEDLLACIARRQSAGRSRSS